MEALGLNYKKKFSSKEMKWGLAILFYSKRGRDSRRLFPEKFSLIGSNSNIS